MVYENIKKTPESLHEWHQSLEVTRALVLVRPGHTGFRLESQRWLLSGEST